MKQYLRLFKFIWPHKFLFLGSGICMVMSALFDGVTLGMIMPLADIVFTGKKIVVPASLPGFLADFVGNLNSIPPFVLLNYIALGVIVLYLLKGLFGFLQSYFMTDISALVVRDIRSTIYTKFHALSLDYFTHMRGGELMSRITNDVGLVGNAISFGATDLLYQSLQVVVFAAMILLIHPRLALLSLIILPLISFPILKVGTVLKKISRQTQEKMADINALLYETILGMRVIKGFNMEKAQVKKFVDTNNSFYKLSMRATKRMLLLSPFTEMIGVIAAVVVLFVEGKEVLAGRMSFGTLGVSLAALLSMLRPFKKLSQVNSIIAQALAGSERIHHVLDTVPTVGEKPDARIMPLFERHIVFEHVFFSYGHVPVLKDIHMTVKRGEITAIVGPSGAGKSTLLDLVPRFYDPDSGRILIDGVDIREFTFNSVRSHIGIVTQETILFNDSVAGNIAFGMPDATAAHIEQAAKQAYVHDVIMKLKNGYDTFIGDRGVKLSGGERQRIAIARAMLKNAPILILDEATSQLDTESERLVQDALNFLMQGRTVFVIAHRLSTIRHATRIIVMNEGRIVEQGTHEQLVNTAGGLYQKLCLNQLVE
ncbi:MAG: ABC transporter ATP-binding protein [Candidatus Omnitrophica bacterium]|nr:ABC transporter ATP-binding protein [Candidatus Omnitrophota bacterium]MDD5775295.1 ABC transporter ATP-binding protein [Candidatus Omnitrophota bacterium]